MERSSKNQICRKNKGGESHPDILERVKKC